MNNPSGPADRAFADLVSKAEADPAVLGLILHGSRTFEGMATAHSDYDVGLIFEDREQGYQRWRGLKSSDLDIFISSLSTWLAELDVGDNADIIDVDGNRYVTANAHVLIDRADGQITAIVRTAATCPVHSRERLPTMLDAYLNLLYRSLKSWRDGRTLEAHLDAARSIDFALWVIFAMHQRVRPPNKYVRWELQRRPLGDTAWEAAHLLGQVQRILADGDPETQRSLFRDIEATARAGGLGETVDSWGDDVQLFRGVRPT